MCDPICRLPGSRSRSGCDEDGGYRSLVEFQISFGSRHHRYLRKQKSIDEESPTQLQSQQSGAACNVNSAKRDSDSNICRISVLLSTTKGTSTCRIKRYDVEHT
jgi:hypothetical protein